MAAIGIDLGNANTRVAVFRNDWFYMIPHEGQSMMPSIVAFIDRGRLVGQTAKTQANIDPRNAISGALKFLGAVQYLGLKYNDNSVQNMINTEELPFEVTKNLSAPEEEQLPLFKVRHKNVWVKFSPVEILAMILKRAKKDAETYLGQPVKHAVITIPTSFDYTQRFAVKDAATIAGIDTLLLIHASTAALSDLAYTQKIPEERNVLVCDIGARYYDVTLATLEEGIHEVKAVSGAFSSLNEAGESYDMRLLNYAINAFEREHPKDFGSGGIRQNLRAVRRLKAACEDVKRQLSSTQEAVIEIEELHAGKDFRLSVSRTKFEELIQDLVRSLLDPIERVLRDAKMDKKSIDDVVLIGGSSRIPKIRNFISAFFDNKEPNLCLNPEETSARGAAVFAAIYSRDTTSRFTDDILLLDVTPKSLGIETEGGVMTALVKRNTTIPTKKSEVFNTSEGQRHNFLVTVFEGERARTKDNVQLGEAKITIPPVSQDRQGVEVTFDVDRHCLVNVTLKDMSTGKKQNVKMDGWSDRSFKRLTKSEIESSVAAEEKMEAEDDLEQRRIEARNTLEELLYSIQAWIRSVHQARRVEDGPTVNRLSSIVDGTLSWMDSDPLATLSEFESRTEQLRKLEKEATEEQTDSTERKDEDVFRRTHSRAENRSAEREEQGVPSSHTRDHVSSSTSTQKQRASFHATVADDLDRGANFGVQEAGIKTIKESSGPVPSTEEHSGNDEHFSPMERMLHRKVLAYDRTQGIERSSTPRTSERGLAALFNTSDENSRTYTDSEFNQISTYLKNTGQPDWSQVPRLYTVLRLIDGLDLLEVFIQQGITDIWFPFGQTTLPRVLSPSIKANFLKYQDVVLSKSLLFEKNPERRHTAFLKDEPLPYEVVGKLGAGAHGQVDKVMSTVSHREYARKLFQRVRGMRKDAIKSFLTELQVLKRIQHYHCVELVQSYTDPKYFALIMSPVGDCNLLEYYSIALNDPDKSSLLRSFFGCLANALQYLHSIKIRHRDIKPHNILVKGDRVFLTDFGIALDWEELSKSTTTADSGKTWLYAAPEVARYEKRNTSADIWSLGCVFMEIATTLKGHSLSAMRNFFEQETGNYRFYANISLLTSWIDVCRQSGLEKDDVVFDWALLMLEEDPTKRPTAASLHHDINTESVRQGVPFSGTCCMEAGESSSFEDESGDEAWDMGADEMTVTPEKAPEYA
ncbi:HSP70-domain-containing protein [Bimuria novae-zelandiae CBS 107.79]|uniref:HSP70-domain-containing protein n=1 Tax=Bimuria novae-zelandiae CBS 107.79 TaxID=1447943 RepID=A0A6A5VY53_9PLEO|nr:HSP70-domain-containing protein [Bimuria novae-zelandiae CBS 107.79]